MLGMAAFVCMDKRRVLQLRWQLRCLQWVTRRVIWFFSSLKMALQLTGRFQHIAGSQLPRPACGQPGRVSASSLTNSHQQATASSLPHRALYSPYLTTSLCSLSLFPPQFTLFLAIHFSCLYGLLPYCSSLSSSNQIQLIWKYLTNDHCIYRMKILSLTHFRQQQNAAVLHWRQVFTSLPPIHVRLQTLP